MDGFIKLPLVFIAFPVGTSIPTDQREPGIRESGNQVDTEFQSYEEVETDELREEKRRRNLGRTNKLCQETCRNEPIT